MNHTKTKPACLLIGGTEEKKRHLTRLLRDEVTIVAGSPENCIEAARRSGARVVVMFWESRTDSLSHELSKNVPGIEIIVERNTNALRARGERNGFNAISDQNLSVEELADRIRSLCLAAAASVPLVRRDKRVSDVASLFMRHVPGIQASVDESQKLCEQFLEALRSATGSTRGVVFYSADAEGDYVLCASKHVRLAAHSTSVPFDSEMAAYLAGVGTAVLRQDEDLPAMVGNFMDQFSCDLILPVIGEGGLVAWIMLQVGKAAEHLHHDVLQTIAFFASESFRLNRQSRRQVEREGFFQAGLDQAVDAVLVLDEKGRVSYLSNRKSLLKFKDSAPRSYRALMCGKLKNAIRRGLEANNAAFKWDSEEKDGTICVRRSSGKTIVLVQAARELSGNDVRIEKNVWDEILSWAGDQFSAGDSSASEAIESKTDGFLPLSSLRRSLLPDPKRDPIKVTIAEETGQIGLSPLHHRAVRSFLEGIVRSATKTIKITSDTITPSEGLRLNFICEESISDPKSRLSAGGSAQPLGPSLLLLMAAEVAVQKRPAAFGCKWTLILGETQFQDLRSTMEYISGQNGTLKEHLVLPQLPACDTGESHESSEGVPTPGKGQRRPAYSA